MGGEGRGNLEQSLIEGSLSVHRKQHGRPPTFGNVLCIFIFLIFISNRNK